MGPDTSLPAGRQNFDPQFCGKFTRITAAVCAVIVLCVVTVLTAIDSSKTRCPGWVIAGDAGMIWFLVVFSAFTACAVCYNAFRWRRIAQQTIDKIEWGERNSTGRPPPLSWLGHSKEDNAYLARTINFNVLFPVVMVLFTLFTAVPLILIAASCV